jgi:tetratricopeptide (TPR) repeat protein
MGRNDTNTPGYAGNLRRDTLIVVIPLVLVALIFTVIHSGGPNPGASRFDDSDLPLEGLHDVERLVAEGNRLMDVGRYGEAIRNYSRALIVDSTLVDVRVDRGSCYFAVGRYDDAVADFATAISIEPRHATAHFNLGVAYGALGSDSLMIAQWEYSLGLEPDGELADRIKRALNEYKNKAAVGD